MTEHLPSARPAVARRCTQQVPNRRATVQQSRDMTHLDDLGIPSDAPFSDAVVQFQNLTINCDALAFLIGAGCSKCAGLPLTSELTDTVLNNPNLNDAGSNLLTAVSEQFSDTARANIEDYLSEIVDLLAITDRRVQRGATQKTVAVGSTSYTAQELRTTSDNIKRAIAGAIEQNVSISTHQDFVAAVHRPVRVGKMSSAQPVDYLVLNYDTLIEDALGLERVRYADGLSGGATAWWDPSTFDAPALSARVIKLHGSLDWHQSEDHHSPRRIGRRLAADGQGESPVLIWPSTTKYQEAQLDPFAKLWDRARRALSPDPGLQRLLVICGYSFGDSHVNLELDKALHESDASLTVAVFTADDEPTGLSKQWVDDASVRERVLIFANRGFFHGDTHVPSEKNLTWWKFETLTSILNGPV